MESKAKGAPQRVRVDLGERSYDIVIGRGLLSHAAEYLQPLKLGRHGVIITDTNVESRYAGVLRETLAKAGMTVEILSVPAGEASKSLRQANRLFEKLPSYGLDRQSFVIALGGGVVGDLAGFVAASYLRGIALVQVPTSLLAQVDSSVGGKVGVNLPQGKNLVGAFYQPKLVLADTDTLSTLPDRELRSGFAEVIKYGAIRDAQFFAWLEQDYKKVLALDAAAVGRVVRRCCELKAEVVSADERESGLRAILNFGHTLGHAMEALSEYVGLLHGEAISMGMCCGARLSVMRAGLGEAEAKRVGDLIAASGLPTKLAAKYKVEELLAAARLDKKARNGKLRFVLLKRLGEATVSDAVTDADLTEVVNVCR
ncbi:MAG TPA: 3-dehydroquinate synthase [Verrucomicrobiae bacterium]|nr:3-dehydroquinate synthase [Verrucomicrobiae bacterium]